MEWADIIVEECAQTSSSREITSEGSMWDELNAEDLEDYRFECLYCDFKTLNEELWTAHVNYLHRSPQKHIDQDEEGENIDLETLKSEQVESKLHHEIDIVEDETACFKNESEFDDNFPQDEEGENVNPDKTQKKEDVESKLHEEIDLDENKATYFKDVDNERESDENPLLRKEMDIDEEGKIIDLDEYKMTNDHIEFNKDKADENYIERNEDLADAAPDWPDIAVEENNEIQNVFFCDQCSYKSHQKDLMKIHSLVMHTASEKIKWFECDKCSYKSKLRECLNSHVKLKHSEMTQHIQLFYCDKCNYKCKANKTLRMHILRKHEGNNEDPEKTQKNEDVESKLHEEIDLDEDKASCLEAINDKHELADNLSLREEIDLDEVGKNVDPEKTQNCEDVELKLHEEIDLDENKATCMEAINDKHEMADNLSLREEIDLDEVGKNVDPEKTQNCEDVESKLHEEIDLDENKGTYVRAVDDERESEENPSLGKEVDIYEEGNNNIYLGGNIIISDCRDFNKDKSAPHWEDINVEDNNEIHHVPISESRKLFFCDQCSYTSYWKDCVKRHVVTIHTAPENITWFNCDKCSYKCKLLKHLNYHVKRNHTSDKGPSWFHCDKCSFKSKLFNKLNNHVKRKHTSDEEPSWFHCDKCSFTSKLFNNLNDHVKRKHTSDKDLPWFYCDKCSFKCKLRNTLKHHVKRSHTCAKAPWCCCTVCMFRTKYKEILEQHERGAMKYCIPKQ